jgi:hypothetical protein
LAVAISLGDFFLLETCSFGCASSLVSAAGLRVLRGFAVELVSSMIFS